MIVYHTIDFSWIKKHGLHTAVLVALVIHSIIPTVVSAQETEQKTSPVDAFAVAPKFPVAADREPLRIVTVVATAYNSLEAQTDSTPFITASGTRTRHGVVAANFLRIGTRVRFPDIYGGTTFIVEDRMNSRYGAGRVDIWMEGYADAKTFGAQRLTMEIYN